jgi:Chitobiase/beta-hexosaminidase C-terminal domain/Bacterial Ig domain/Right handed beta helix region
MKPVVNVSVRGVFPLQLFSFLVTATLGLPVMSGAQTPQTFYVSPTGSDVDAGTELQPFATIQHAADIVNPGDTVVVEDGTYTGIGTATSCASSTSRPIVCLSRGGTLSAPVTFRAQHRGGAHLDGQDNSSTHGFRFLADANYITVEGFDISGVGSSNSGASGILIYSGGHDVKIVANDIHDVGRLCTDHVYGMNGIFVQNARVTIEGNRIHDIGRFAGGENGCAPTTLNYQNHDHGIYIDGKNDGTAPGANDILVANNLIYDVRRGWGIQIYPDPVAGLTVVNNAFAFSNPYRNGHIIFAASTSDARVENNIFYAPRNVALNFYSGSQVNLQVTNNLVFDAELLNIAPEGALILWNQSGDPQVINATVAPYDFHLASTSPAIDQGLTVLEVPTDFDDVLRTGLYDIGAYEFHTATSPATVATPTISPSGGLFSASVPVTITTATIGATIKYTIDGSAPSAASTTYLAPFIVDAGATIKAQAFSSGMNDSGVAEATFDIAATIPDTLAPTVAIISPDDGARISGWIHITANATDDVGVAAVTLLADGQTLAVRSEAPYTVSWRAKGILGPHVLTAIATDAAGNSATASVIVWR